MSSGSVIVDGFQSSQIFNQLHESINASPEKDRRANVQKTNAVFQFDVTAANGQTKSWTIDLKNGLGGVKLGAAGGRPDIVITIKDATLVDLARGKLNGQKAFMQGLIKVKGNMMLAMKLDTILKPAAGKQTAAAAKATGGPASVSATKSTAPAKPNTTAAAGPATQAKKAVPAVSGGSPASGLPPSAKIGGGSTGGLKATGIFAGMKKTFEGMPPAAREALVKKLDITGGSAPESFNIDMKNGKGAIGPGKSTKPDATITMTDANFVELAEGRLNPQKAFMGGKMKIVGNIMSTQKLDPVLKELKGKAKL